MITINVLLKVKAEKEQDYLAFLDDMVQKSRQDEKIPAYLEEEIVLKISRS